MVPQNTVAICKEGVSCPSSFHASRSGPQHPSLRQRIEADRSIPRQAGSQAVARVSGCLLETRPRLSGFCQRTSERALKGHHFGTVKPYSRVCCAKRKPSRSEPQGKRGRESLGSKYLQGGRGLGHLFRGLTKLQDREAVLVEEEAAVRRKEESRKRGLDVTWLLQSLSGRTRSEKWSSASQDEPVPEDTGPGWLPPIFRKASPEKQVQTEEEEEEDKAIMFSSLTGLDEPWASILLLNLLAALYGSNAVAAKFVEEALVVPPASLACAVKFTFAALAFSPVLWNVLRSEKSKDKKTVLAGIELGLWLMAGIISQTVGMKSGSNSISLLFTFTIVLVPLLEVSTGRRSISQYTWLASLAALTGMGLLKDHGGLTLDLVLPPVEDLWGLFSSAMFAIQIFRAEMLCQKFDPLRLVACLLGVLATLSVGWEGWSLLHAGNGIDPLLHQLGGLPVWPLMYGGLIAGGLGGLLELTGLQNIHASTATLIYTTIPIWGAFFSFLVRGESIGESSTLVGGSLMFASSLAAGLLQPKKEQEPPPETEKEKGKKKKEKAAAAQEEKPEDEKQQSMIMAAVRELVRGKSGDVSEQDEKHEVRKGGKVLGLKPHEEDRALKRQIALSKAEADEDLMSKAFGMFRKEEVEPEPEPEKETLIEKAMDALNPFHKEEEEKPAPVEKMQRSNSFGKAAARLGELGENLLEAGEHALGLGEEKSKKSGDAAAESDDEGEAPSVNSDTLPAAYLTTQLKMPFYATQAQGMMAGASGVGATAATGATGAGATAAAAGGAASTAAAGSAGVAATAASGGAAAGAGVAAAGSGTAATTGAALTAGAAPAASSALAGAAASTGAAASVATGAAATGASVAATGASTAAATGAAVTGAAATGAAVTGGAAATGAAVTGAAATGAAAVTGGVTGAAATGAAGAGAAAAGSTAVGAVTGAATAAGGALTTAATSAATAATSAAVTGSATSAAAAGAAGAFVGAAAGTAAGGGTAASVATSGAAAAAAGALGTAAAVAGGGVVSAAAGGAVAGAACSVVPSAATGVAAASGAAATNAAAVGGGAAAAGGGILSISVVANEAVNAIVGGIGSPGAGVIGEVAKAAGKTIVQAASPVAGAGAKVLADVAGLAAETPLAALVNEVAASTQAVAGIATSAGAEASVAVGSVAQAGTAAVDVAIAGSQAIEALAATQITEAASIVAQTAAAASSTTEVTSAAGILGAAFENAAAVEAGADIIAGADPLAQGLTTFVQSAGTALEKAVEISGPVSGEAATSASEPIVHSVSTAVQAVAAAIEKAAEGALPVASESAMSTAASDPLASAIASGAAEISAVTTDAWVSASQAVGTAIESALPAAQGAEAAASGATVIDPLASEMVSKGAEIASQISHAAAQAAFHAATGAAVVAGANEVVTSVQDAASSILASAGDHFTWLDSADPATEEGHRAATTVLGMIGPLDTHMLGGLLPLLVGGVAVCWLVQAKVVKKRCA